jgi:hypothetical protein
VTSDELRAAALALPATSERPAPRGGHPQLVTNGRCFAELPDGDPTTARIWSDDGWQVVDLPGASAADVAALLLVAWRRRAKKLDVATYDYALGRDDLADVFEELRSWPELTERSVGDFHAGGRAFLHFHHYETGRHADVKDGLGWGEPIAFPLGRPSPKVVAPFLREVKRRLAVTLDAMAAAKRH